MDQEEERTVTQIRKRLIKKHCCYFCSKLFSDIRKHWKHRHSNEPLYQDAVKNAETTSHNPRFHRAFANLTKMGDAKHNEHKNNEDKIVVRRLFGPKKKINSSHLICPHCKGYFSERNLRYHKTCTRSKEDSQILSLAKIEVIDFPPIVTQDLKLRVLRHFKKESQCNIIYNDPIILHYAGIQFQSLKESTFKGAADIERLCADIRMLADIVSIGRKRYNINFLHDLFLTEKVDTIYDIIDERCGFDGTSFSSPASAQAACNILRKVMKEVITMAISQNKASLKQKYEDLYNVFIARQLNRVTKRATRDRTERQRLKTESIPTTAQVNNLLKVLDEGIKTNISDIQREVNKHTYYSLMKCVLARIIVFNRKRPGDVHRMLIDEFRVAQKLEDEFLKTLPQGERDIFRNIKRIKTQHKLNKISAVLITQEEEHAICLLLANRHNVGIDECNKFIFATPKNKRYPFIRGDDALSEICRKHNIDYNMLQATKLRKHLATTTSNASQSDQSALSDFMAHSFNIHKTIYTISQTSTDISRVGRLLFDASGSWPIENEQPSQPTNELMSPSSWSIENEQPSQPTDELMSQSSWSIENEQPSQPTDELMSQSDELMSQSSLAESETDSAFSGSIEKGHPIQQIDTLRSQPPDVEDDVGSAVSKKPLSSKLPFIIKDLSVLLENNINCNQPEKEKGHPIQQIDTLRSQPPDVEDDVGSAVSKKPLSSKLPFIIKDLSVLLANNINCNQPEKEKSEEDRFLNSLDEVPNDRLQPEKEKSEEDCFLNSLVDEAPTDRLVRIRERTPVRKSTARSQTWRTPLKTTIRGAFSSFLNEEKVPSLSEVRRILCVKKMRGLSKTDVQIRAWLLAEIKRRKCRTKRGWTTPQKQSLRKIFSHYYDQTQKTSIPSYPSTRQLQAAVSDEPELRTKTVEQLRSKLQHEFSVTLFRKEEEEKIVTHSDSDSDDSSSSDYSVYSD